LRQDGVRNHLARFQSKGAGRGKQTAKNRDKTAPDAFKTKSKKGLRMSSAENKREEITTNVQGERVPSKAKLKKTDKIGGGRGVDPFQSLRNKI